MDFDILKEKYPKLYKTLNEYHGIDEPSKYDVDELIGASQQTAKYVRLWRSGILKKIEHELQMRAHTLTFGFIPNYGGEVIFSKKIKPERWHVISIQFYVSLLDNIYTIQILDTIESLHTYPYENLEVTRSTLKELWVSPEEHPYGEVFLKIQSCLERNLDKPIYLPYSIQEVNLKGFNPPRSLVPKKQYCVRDAFFEMVLPQYTDGALICGNHDYMIEKLE